MIPNTKISHTILEFGKSIILQLPDDYSKEEFEAAISIVIVVWNALVMDAWNETDKFERELMERLEEGPKQAKIEVRRLIKRKKAKFSTDLRAVGNYWVKEQDGEYIFGCEARGNVENFPAEKTKH
ncbi:hypothetical protein LRB11_17070 [Ectothiorhodospira haloalkaliphila]|uniref:hypothetical protein n=1 Tax=Ectothiorhodospira haloalkaliphila TaxID=421628 RepID=UPI001EE8975B|nr:hypothetical protein [Ectothiorhodospira haloalkaliphila]MCG5526616.1 hypothetical protein [Ectothiorhodospira haloalkaliphila]